MQVGVIRMFMCAQSTCAVHPGASGGALVNKAGQLVGMVVCNAK